MHPGASFPLFRVCAGHACLYNSRDGHGDAGNFQSGSGNGGRGQGKVYRSSRGVPTMFIMELEVLEKENYDISSLRTGIMAGGAPIGPD